MSEPSPSKAKSYHPLKSKVISPVEKSLRACIIYTGSKVPAEVIADIATISDRLAVDCGHLERLDIMDIGPKDVFSQIRDKQFKEIQEKVAWTVDEKNVDKIVTHREHIKEVVRDLQRRSRT